MSTINKLNFGNVSSAVTLNVILLILVLEVMFMYSFGLLFSLLAVMDMPMGVVRTGIINHDVLEKVLG